MGSLATFPRARLIDASIHRYLPFAAPVKTQVSRHADPRKRKKVSRDAVTSRRQETRADPSKTGGRGHDREELAQPSTKMEGAYSSAEVRDVQRLCCCTAVTIFDCCT